MNSRHIVVIGGGITGLAAAHHLEKQIAANDLSVEYTLLERADRTGGKIVTTRTDDYVIEGGPDCFLTRKPWALNLCQELDLEKNLIGTNEENRGVYVLSNRRMHRLPEGVMLIVPTRFLPFALSPLFSIPGKLRMGMDLVIPRRKIDGDETLGGFVRRRLGKEALEKMAEPLLSGIHVSDPERLSLKGSFPRLLETERKYGSLIKGMLAAKKAAAWHKNGKSKPLPMFMSLEGGMNQLVEAVSGQLDSQRVCLGSDVVAMSRQNGGEASYEIHTMDGRQLRADAVILATPANVSGKLVSTIDPALADELGSIRHVSTAVVSLGYRLDPHQHPLDAFGFIVPSTEGRRITACTWTSTKFSNRAPKSHQLIRCFIGGPNRESLAEQDDDSLTAMVKEEVREVMGIDVEPELVQISRWEKANPQYDLDHLDRVKDMRARARARGGLYLAGCAYDGVGVPDCIRQGQEAATAALDSVLADK